MPPECEGLVNKGRVSILDFPSANSDALFTIGTSANIAFRNEAATRKAGHLGGNEVRKNGVEAVKKNTLLTPGEVRKRAVQSG